MKGRLLGLVCVASLLASRPAVAGGPHGHQHGGHGGHSGVRASFFIGGGYPGYYRPYWGPAYYPPPAYYYYPYPAAYPVYPAPVAVAPAPVVAAPVVAPSFSFSFGH